MSNYRIWPIAVLVIAGVFYFWGDEDQPEADKSAQRQTSPVPSPKPQDFQAPKTPTWDPPGGYQSPNTPYTQQPREYGVPGTQTPGQYAPPSGLRFRPEQEQAVNGRDYQPSYPYPQGPRHPMTSQEQTIQDPYGYQSYPQPMDNYRFRPLNKQRQDRRWQGNYGPTPYRETRPVQPSPYAPGPAYPSRSTQSKSLWANSWEER